MNDRKQKKIAENLIDNLESLEESDFDYLYNQLDVDYQLLVDKSIREFVDFSVGSEHWDSDD